MSAGPSPVGRLRAAVDTLDQQISGRCCDLHGPNCEPPSELCCRWCAEVNHPTHAPGSDCVLGRPNGADRG